MRKFENAALFIEAAGGYLRRMGVNRYRRETHGCCHVREMLAEAPFIDRQVFGERQENSWNNAMG